MRKSLANKIRSSIFVAARQVGSKPTGPKIEMWIRDNDVEIFRQWEKASPAPATRLQFIGRALNPIQSRDPRPPVGAISLWPIGPRQRWDLEVAHGHFHGPAPENLVAELFLYNYGHDPVLDVLAEYSGGMGEYVPRIEPQEAVVLGWAEEGDLVFEDFQPPSNDRYLGFTATFTERGKRRKLQGSFYVRRGELPWLFQEAGGNDALDRASDVR